MKKITFAILCTKLLSVFPIFAQKKMEDDKKWWKEAVVYQIYPRSFKDSNGDGIGDLKGITSKLDYIKSLGVNTIWLNPIYKSPNDDNGYDISDYQAINPEFGSLADFNEMLQEMHKRGLKLVMDVVVNHSSDEHEWFKKSRSSRDSKYRNYYHWWPAEKGTPPARYSLFDVNHDAWKFDSTTNAYYLHYFSRKQPDLNWENPALRQEIYAMMRFWADKGIDGFRLDAFQFASKDISYPKYGDDLMQGNFIKYYAMGPNLHNYLQEMNAEVFSKYNVMTVAEGAGRNFEDAHNLVDASRKELNMAYAFDAVDMAKPEGYDVVQFKKTFSNWDAEFAKNGWLSIFLANHDQARLVSRFGNDSSPELRDLSSKMLNTFLFTMRGTPFCYFGDELAMTNIRFNSIEEYNDIPTKNEYIYLENHGGDLKKYLETMKFSCRDNGRTPMQWNTEKNAGFTTGLPWLKVNPNFVDLNVAKQEKNASSVLNYFKKLSAMRKNHSTLVYGKYSVIDLENSKIYAYTREDKNGKYLIILNFKNENVPFALPQNLSGGQLILANYPTRKSITKALIMKPYEAFVLKIK